VGFVGGRVDDDETVLAALHREVLEETGLRIAESMLFGVFSDPTRVIAYPDGNVCQVLSIVFLVVPVEGDEPVASDESLELRWVSRDELGRLELWPVHRPIRDAFLAEPHEVVVA
jgi:8-oxo-dGTP pyrophosphatase MutT (NUDIX family)